MDVYTRHNAAEDLEEGQLTFKKFVSVEQTLARIKNGSQLYQVSINSNEIAGIFEIEDNHLTLLYVNDKRQFKGLGTFCIHTIKFLLKSKYSNLTVFASPYSIGFYIKNGFVKLSEDIQIIKGMRYYSLELKL